MMLSSPFVVYRVPLPSQGRALTGDGTFLPQPPSSLPFLGRCSSLLPVVSSFQDDGALNQSGSNGHGRCHIHRLDFKLQAGRSKAKRVNTSGGRIEGSRSAGKQTPIKGLGTPWHNRRRSGPRKPRTEEAIPPVKDETVHSPPRSLEAYSREPDEFYKYGPYGPYGDRAEILGTFQKGSIFSNDVSMYSPVKDDAEREARRQGDVCVTYEQKISTFTEKPQFFWVFVKHPPHLKDGPIRWKDWTLVAQVAIDSSKELDRWSVIHRIEPKMHNIVTECVSWFRPDLVFVKKPLYQVRFEPQREFLDAWIKLLDDSSEGSYYGRFCKILGVDVDTKEEDVVSRFSKLDEEKQLACLGYLLTNNPVDLLHPWTWHDILEDKRLRSQGSQDEMTEGNLARTVMDGIEDIYTEKEEELEEEQENEEDFSDDLFFDDMLPNELMDIVGDDDMIEEADRIKWNEKFSKAIKTMAGEEGDESEELSSGQFEEEEEEEAEGEGEGEEEKGLHGVEARIEDKQKGDLRSTDSGKYVKAVVRPFTYSNFVKEAVMIHHILKKERHLLF